MFERFQVIDVDTHITEPPDTWSARISRKWGDAIPHIERIDGYDTWVIAGKPWAKPGNTAMAGFDGDAAGRPEDVRGHAPRRVGRRRPASSSWIEQQIYAQVLYPNIGGFGAGSWLGLRRPGLRARVRAGLQRLPGRFRVRRSRPAAAHRVAALLGRRCDGRRDRALRRARAPRDQLLQPAGRLRSARSLGPALGPDLVRRRRTPACTVNFHIGGGRIGEQLASGG